MVVHKSIGEEVRGGGGGEVRVARCVHGCYGREL